MDKQFYCYQCHKYAKNVPIETENPPCLVCGEVMKLEEVNNFTIVYYESRTLDYSIDAPDKTESKQVFWHQTTEEREECELDENISDNGLLETDEEES